MILTDFLDGYIAGMLQQASRLGQFLDPVSDKITIIASLIILYIYKDFPFWIVVLITVIDIYSITGGIMILAKRDIQVAPNLFGKLMVCSIGLSAVIYILEPSCYIRGISLQSLSVYLIILFLVLSTLLYWKAYAKVYFEDKV